MKKIVVLGAGLIGKAIAIDLAKSFEVTAVDINPSNLEKLSECKNIATHIADLADPEEFQNAVKDFDLVIGALPGYMGYRAVKQSILAGKDIVDISFFREEPYDLDQLAKEKNVTAIIDAGVAPGMGNVILGYHNKRMEVYSYKCYSGGLPFKREWPYEYKAVFSPMDVLEEYTRPARYVLNGELVVREALSEDEMKFFEPIGSLEAWNTDGLRTLIKTMNIPNMIEKTLRYPGTMEYIKVLRETGFFDNNYILVNGKQIRPIDFTAKLLFPVWELKRNEEDYTMMRVTIKGKEKGKERKYTYNLFDKYDKKTGTTSMARTTGYTCTAITNLFAQGMVKHKGLCPPEYLGVDEKNYRFIMDYLKDRGVEYTIIQE
ncbi:MAG: saccharopine dehydrogenase C-terminal domain-containing protein [Bacteroidales bacterium]|jgi:saccharopine dehydrogenase-like NADP-dependent oxidoreductase|nr:saccharopine dehydrogenase C-terminal domain-containing protein [Bacteroidales bacterium]